MKYELVMRDGIESMQEAVNEKLRDGWKLQGGISISETNVCHIYCQAIVKSGEVKENKKPSKKIDSLTLRNFLDSYIPE